ncbi:hypothetical protein HS7_03190 [Sulfolobales archaeon HS-7]|nr:hypothetical protein HS7_03190 [Sulfolobales archaeon HS-7]
MALKEVYDVFEISVNKKNVCLYFKGENVKVKYSCCSRDYMKYINILEERKVIPEAEFRKVARLFILMKVLPYTKSKYKAVDIVRSLPDMEVSFWFSKFSALGNRAVSSFMKLYL